MVRDSITNISKDAANNYNRLQNTVQFAAIGTRCQDFLQPFAIVRTPAVSSGGVLQPVVKSQPIAHFKQRMYH